MRAIVLVSVLLAPAAVATDVLVHVDATGHFRAGLLALGVGAVDDGDPVPPAGVGPVNLARWSFVPDACHPQLWFRLHYAPQNASVASPSAYVAVRYVFQVELFDADGARLASHAFADPGAASYALAPEQLEGRPLRADLYLLQGASVDWWFRVQGWQNGACDGTLG